MTSIFCALLAGMLALVGCSSQDSTAPSGEETDNSGNASYTIDYGTSELYTQADMDAAIQVIMAEFDTWTGAEMKSIAFTDDKTCEDNVAYCNDLRDKDDPEFDQAIVFTSSFHSPSGEDAKDTAWEPDTDYNDWTWTLGRTDGGDWKLLTWGYA